MTMRAVQSGLRAAALAAPFLFAACTVGPNYQRPALSLSASYGETGSSQLVSGSDIPAQWWTVFHSSDLDDLVALALKNNSSVEAADAALRAAHELTRAQRGADYPTIGVSVQPTRQDVARNLASPLESNADLYNLTTTQISIAYTPDLFGANRRAVESLVAQEDQQRFQLEAARLTLASNVVAAAIQDALLRAQIDETKAIILEQQQAVESFERQLRLGQVARADLAAQQATLAQAQAGLPPLEKQFAINRDLLAALVGRTPGEPVDVRFDLQSLALPEQLPLSLPAQLVEHRPDVRIAEAQLRSASAQIGIAEAARWPNLEIGATAGGAALSALPAFGSSANFWSLAATLTQPIFDGGVLKHKQRAAEATYRQAAAQYQGTVIGAFQNTADVLHALSTDADAVRADEAAEDASRVSLEVARRQLAAGDASALAVLSAEQADHQTRLTLLQARASRYTDVAALFQALGGGWWNNQAPAVTAQSN